MLILYPHLKYKIDIKLNKQLESFYRLLKLKAHYFKDAKNNKLTTGE